MAWYRCGMNATYNATTVSRSGAICNYVANVGGVPLSRFIANITPIQAGSGDPSPSNPRPIIGWSECKVTRCGKNIFDNVYQDITSTIQYRHIKVNNGTYTMSSNCPLSSSNSSNIFFLAGYVTSGASTSTNGVSNGVPRTVTTNDGYITVGYRSAGNVNPANYESQIENGSTATAYAPYTEQTATIDLGGTYYLATLNVLTGLLTVLGLLTTYDKNSSWTRNTSGIFYTDAPNGIDDLYISNMFECFLPKGSSNALKNGQCRLNTNSRYINFKVTSCDTVDDFKAFLGDNTIQIVYTLATPVTYQLTPAQLTQLLGENNVWADSGDSEVDFFKIIRT